MAKVTLRERLAKMSNEFSPILAARVLEGKARRIMKQENKSYKWRLNQLLILDARLGQEWPARRTPQTKVNFSRAA